LLESRIGRAGEVRVAGFQERESGLQAAERGADKLTTRGEIDLTLQFPLGLPTNHRPFSKKPTVKFLTSTTILVKKISQTPTLKYITGPLKTPTIALV
jgi:hypothetical protein